MEWSFEEVARIGSSPVYGTVTDGERLIAGGNSYASPFAAWCESGELLEHPDAEGAHRFVRGLRRPWIRDGRIFMPGEYGLLATSDDRGRTWTHVDTGGSACMFRVRVDPNGRLLVPNDSGVLGSDDGETWSWDHRGGRPLGVCFTDSQAIFYGAAITIREGGRYREVFEAPALLCGMAEAPNGVLITVGDGGQAYRSRDGGESWETLTVPRVDLEDCIATDEGVLAVGARGTMIHTADDGDSWEPIRHPFGNTHLWMLAEGDRGDFILGAAKGLVARIEARGGGVGGGDDDLDDLD